LLVPLLNERNKNLSLRSSRLCGALLLGGDSVGEHSDRDHEVV
jgi:hypothetical protein